MIFEMIDTVSNPYVDNFPNCHVFKQGTALSLDYIINLRTSFYPRLIQKFKLFDKSWKFTFLPSTTTYGVSLWQIFTKPSTLSGKHWSFFVFIPISPHILR